MGVGSHHRILFLDSLSQVSCSSVALTEVTYPWIRDILALKARCSGGWWEGSSQMAWEADTVMLCVRVSSQLPGEMLTELCCLVHVLSHPHPTACRPPTANSAPARAAHSSTGHGHRGAAGGMVTVGSHHVFEWCEFLGVCLL